MNKPVIRWRLLYCLLKGSHDNGLYDTVQYHVLGFNKSVIRGRQLTDGNLGGSVTPT